MLCVRQRGASTSLDDRSGCAAGRCGGACRGRSACGARARCPCPRPSQDPCESLAADLPGTCPPRRHRERDPRTGRVERHTYRVRARLISFAMEDDSDVHLVIARPARPPTDDDRRVPGRRLHEGRCSSARGKMKRARTALLRSCGKPGSDFTDLSAMAQLTGAGCQARPAWAGTPRDRAAPGDRLSPSLEGLLMRRRCQSARARGNLWSMPAVRDPEALLAAN